MSMQQKSLAIRYIFCTCQYYTHVYSHTHTHTHTRIPIQHVLHKQHKEETRKKEMDTQKEEKRKADERLREMKETERRKLLEYKGLISSSKRERERSGGKS